jgi:transcriptional regulator with XRE-family HTH domain
MTCVVGVFGAVLLREARARAGLTQTELGRRVGVPANVISRWERGEVAIGLERLDELVRGCGLQLDVALRAADDSQRALMEGYRAMAPGERLDGLCRRVTMLAQLQSREDPFDPRALLRALTDARVSFVVIGGVAAALHGAPHPTYDLDIVPRRGRATPRA